MAAKILPTGTCWCGCGAETTRGRFFLTGHDRFAAAAIIEIEYGNVASFLQLTGYGPGGKNVRHELASHRGKNVGFGSEEPNPSGRLTPELRAEIDALREEVSQGRKFSDSTEIIRKAREGRTEQIQRSMRGQC